MKSMTGFGRAEATVGDVTLTLELRSVNSRYLEFTPRLPRTLSFLEPRIKPYLQSRGIQRGKVDMQLALSGGSVTGGRLVLDRAAAADYINALYQLRDSFSLPDDISVMRVAAARSELFVRESESVDEEAAWQLLLAVLAPATDAFLARREAEGERLLADIREKLFSLRAALDRIRDLSADDVASYRERLTSRVREAMSDAGLAPDEARLLTECAVHADRIAIDEELVRLSSHLASFEELAAGVTAGRQLDFLLQEMNREANTIGSKCLNAAVALEVVEIKCTLEKIREQIQNIE